MSELEEQQKKIIANVRKDTNNLEKQRQCVIKELEKVFNIFIQEGVNKIERSKTVTIMELLYTFCIFRKGPNYVT